MESPLLSQEAFSSRTRGKNVSQVQAVKVVVFLDEEYGDSEPKKVHATPHEPKLKRSKNSQDDR